VADVVPDGSQIAFISDLSGEEELYLVPQDGSKPPTQITKRRQRYALSAAMVPRWQTHSLW